VTQSPGKCAACANFAQWAPFDPWICPKCNVKAEWSFPCSRCGRRIPLEPGQWYCPVCQKAPTNPEAYVALKPWEKLVYLLCLFAVISAVVSYLVRNYWK
jgi:hypothetical protein